MANQAWKSKDSQIISDYAERLEPVEGEGEADAQDDGTRPVSQAIKGLRPEVDGIDFKYVNGPPPKDLLNYKNMDLEMSLWAKTPTGWLSVTVLLIMAFACFFLMWILWILHG